MRITTTLFWGLVTQAAYAGPPVLFWPVACELGQSCYIEDYVDAQSGAGQRDYTCGIKSRDGHQGTDIVLESFADMERGTPVLAAAPGVVAAIRDSMPDIAVTAQTADTVKGKECGNAVRIDHGEGWQTLYCHMKQGSVTVSPGEHIEKGDVIGEVGLSGLTNVPHLHLSVLFKGAIIDPFAPQSSDTCGDAQGNGLWNSVPPYHRTGLYTAGFATSVPGFDAVQTGSARVTQTNPDAPLVLYGFAFLAEDGDHLTLRAAGPEGEIFSHTEVLNSPQKEITQSYGRKAPIGGWPEGAYRGVVRLERDGELIAWRHADIRVTSQ